MTASYIDSLSSSRYSTLSTCVIVREKSAQSYLFEAIFHPATSTVLRQPENPVVFGQGSPVRQTILCQGSPSTPKVPTVLLSGSGYCYCRCWSALITYQSLDTARSAYLGADGCHTNITTDWRTGHHLWGGMSHDKTNSSFLRLIRRGADGQRRGRALAIGATADRGRMLPAIVPAVHVRHHPTAPSPTTPSLHS